MMQVKMACVVFLFFFIYLFIFASRPPTRAGSGARGTSLCEARGRAHQFPLLPRESGAACVCNSSKREGRKSTVFERNYGALSFSFSLG